MFTISHADRVAETTTTEGTGSLTLSGVAADTGLRTFQESGITGYMHYCISDAEGNWEVGRGYFNGTTTISRNSGLYAVLASSNANAAVNFGPGEKRVDLVAPANQFDKRIYFGASQPTANDDSSDGFFDGCIWIVKDPPGNTGNNTFTQTFVCTSAWTGFATWEPLGLVIGRGSEFYDECLTIPTWVNNGRWDLTNKNTFNGNAWAGQDAVYCIALGDSANAENAYSISIGAGKTTSQTKAGGHQGEVIVQGGYTTDATPTDIGYALAKALVMNEDGADSLFIQVVAYSDDGVDCFARNFTALVSIGRSTPTIVAQTTTEVGASAGAAAWDVELAAGTDGPKLTVTGEAARNIRWTATVMRACAHKGF